MNFLIWLSIFLLLIRALARTPGRTFPLRFLSLCSPVLFSWRMYVENLTKCTHLQLLTLLFPSKLESGLIIVLLGFMATVVLVMFYSPLVVPIGQSIAAGIQGIFECALSILYLFGFLAWSLSINRSRAWQVEGGAIPFGIATLFLALAKTAMNLFHFAYEGSYWILLIAWALTIWQSWLGFWWWVNAGMVCWFY